MTQSQSLHIKTYFSNTVEAAVALARQELGPEAMLMNSRRAPAEVQHLGNYEVVFAANPALAREQQSAPPQWQTLLEENGIEPRIVRDLLSGPAPTRKSVTARMEAMISINPLLGRTAAVVGPPGRGKTSTLVKLAVTQGLAAGQPVRVLCADNSRVAAGSQLSSFCEILGLDFQYCGTPSALGRALDSSRDARALTLIDTGGYGPRDIDSAADLARCLTTHKVETHLTLRCEARTAELMRVVERYRIFAPARLIFTGLDETDSFGGLFSVAAESKIPVSFLCSGQAIPEDMEAASSRRIVDLALKEGRTAERAAA